MSIQSNINQGLSIAAFLAQTNPALKAKAEDRAQIKAFEAKQSNLTSAKNIISSEAAALAKKRPRLDESKVKNLEARAEKAEELAGISKEMITAQKKEFERKPTESGYLEINRLEKGLAGEQKKALSLRERAAAIRKRTEEALALAQDEMRDQKNVLDMLKNEPTSYGVKVGELSPNLQKIIEQAYKENGSK